VCAEMQTNSKNTGEEILDENAPQSAGSWLGRHCIKQGGWFEGEVLQRAPGRVLLHKDYRPAGVKLSVEKKQARIRGTSPNSEHGAPISKPHKGGPIGESGREKRGGSGV